MQDQNLGTQKNIATNIKPLKIQHLFTNPKNTAAVTHTQKSTKIQNFKPKKYSYDPCQ